MNRVLLIPIIVCFSFFWPIYSQNFDSSFDYGLYGGYEAMHNGGSYCCGKNITFDEADLNLDKKPHDVPVYQWCKKMARKKVDNCLGLCLRYLGVSQKAFEEKRNAVLKQDRNNNNDFIIGKPFKRDDQKAFLAVFQKLFGDVAIQDDSGSSFSIVGTNIKTLYGNKIIVTSIAGDMQSPVVDGNNICIRLDDFAYLNQQQVLLCCIAHEVGHVLCGHCLDRDGLYELCKHDSENAVFYNFLAAQEFEADIVGVFGDTAIPMDVARFFEHDSHEVYNMGPSMYPETKERINYLRHVAYAMELEKNQLYDFAFQGMNASFFMAKLPKAYFVGDIGCFEGFFKKKGLKDRLF